MKRPDIIQLIIIIIALLLVYKTIEQIPGLIILILSWMYYGMTGGELMEQVIYSGFYVCIYILGILLLINRSRSLASYISTKFDIDRPMKLDPSKNDLLYTVFIGLGMYSLLQRLPVLLNSIWKVFSKEVSHRGGILDLDKPYDPSPDFLLLGIQILLPLLLIIFARDLANYFSEKISNTDEIEEIASEKQ